jgi:hypothetical protein
MKARKAILLLAGLVAVAPPVVLLVLSVLSALAEAEEGPPAEAENARSSTAYVLAVDRWTSFRIPPGQQALKLVTNANVPAIHRGSKDFSCGYSIRYQVVDAHDNVVRDQHYNLSAGFLVFIDEVTGSAVPAHFYRSSDLAPMGSRTLFVNLEGIADRAVRLNVRVSAADAPIADVAARVYFNERPPPYKLRYLWQRMSAAKKERLARANIYTADLLGDDEKRNLLENRWAALAPLGIEGRDYEERRLYMVNRSEADRQAPTILPRGLPVDAHVVGVIPIPESGGCIRVEIEDIDDGPPAGRAPMAYITWFGEDPGDRIDSGIELHGAITTYDRDYGGGYLEIHAGDPIVVRASLASHPADIDITPDPGSVPYYLLRGGEALDFAVSSFHADATALRIDIRRLWLEAPAAAPAPDRLSYQLIDASDRALDGGYISHEERPSSYDVPVGSFGGWRVSDPTRHYFWFPPRAVTLRLRSDQEALLVTVYTRPDVLPRNVRVPEDYLAFEKGDDGLRNWFLIRPRDYAECLRKGSEVLLRIQERPPVYSPHLLSEDFHSDVLEPLGGGIGRKVLTPARDPGDLKLEFSPARFRRLAGEEGENAFVWGRPGESTVSPRLICLKSTDDLASIKLFTDGNPYFQGAAASRSSEMDLPALRPGLYRISASVSEPAELYVNALLEPADSLFIERMVHELGPDGLTYDVWKESAGKETIVVRLFAPPRLASRVRIRARIEGREKVLGIPLDSWTFWTSVFDVRPAGVAAIPVLGSDGESLSGGRMFFLSLGPDLKPGPYRIALTVDEGPPCFVQAVKVASGRRDPRHIFSERDWPGGGARDG